MTTKTCYSDRFEGDGQSGHDPDDTRVRCWFCGHYTHNIELPIWKQGEKVWVPVRTCARGLGHDPFILRRCEAFRPIPQARRIRLPDEAFQRGWRLDYGDDDHMQGRKNAIDC